MKQLQNGNGRRNGWHPMPANKLPPAIRASQKGSEVTFQTAEGVSLRGIPIQVTRHTVTFEFCRPDSPLRLSEVLGEFELALQGRIIYSGRAVVRNLIQAGAKTVCECNLEAAQWRLDGDLSTMNAQKFADEFKVLLCEWEKFYKIAPEFKLVTSDMQAFLIELQSWLDRVELTMREAEEPRRSQLEMESLQSAAPSIIRAIDAFIERFETFAATLTDRQHPDYQAHFRRHMHPLLLSSPFASRAYTKPLGYAGDYGMVNMMLHPVAEGGTLFAKAVNVWLLGQAPAQAHRNRVVILKKQLVEETLRVRKTRPAARILNLGCGPAAEVLAFLKEHPTQLAAEFTLVDFNQETLDFVQRLLPKSRTFQSAHAQVRLVRKSVLQILKDSGRSLVRSPGDTFDYIYCAGLFDYLQKEVCRQILAILYGLVAPGGLLLATNVTEKLNSSRPFRFSMEYLLDWHLIYRDREQFLEVAPGQAPPENVTVTMEETGVNLFLKIRKPSNASGG